jgi:hypothetical protein
MTQDDKASWLDAEATAQQALDLAKKIDAKQRMHLHITMLALTALAKSASRDSIDQLISELERIRDLTGPAGVAAGEVVATAITTLERASKR